MKKCQSFSVCVCVCFSFCWLPYPSLLLLFFFCTYLDVFSLSFIFFSSSETELIKIIHMQAVYRSSLTTLTNVVWETFHIFLFLSVIILFGFILTAFLVALGKFSVFRCCFSFSHVLPVILARRPRPRHPHPQPHHGPASRHRLHRKFIWLAACYKFYMHTRALRINNILKCWR